MGKKTKIFLVKLMDENLQQSFLRFCKTNQFEINPKQVEIIDLLENFISIKKRFLNIFK